MKDKDKTKEQLLDELIHMRKRIAELERAEKEHKRAEDELRQGEEKYRLLVENAGEVILIAQGGILRFVNRRTLELFGYSEEILTTKPFIEFVHPEDREMVFDRHRRRLQGETVPDAYPFRVVANDGTVKWVEGRATVVFWEEEPAALSFLNDITERKRAENALRESEAKYRTLIETTDTGFVIIDQNGTVLDANQEYVRLTGHHYVNEILGRNVTEWTAPYQKERNALAVKECFETGYIRNLEIDYMDSRGKVTPIEINATVVEIKGALQIVTLCRDITERKRAEEALQTSEQKFGAAFMTGLDAIYVATLEEGRLLEVNQEFNNLFGYTREEVIGRTSLELNFYYDPADRARTVSKLKTKGRVRDWELKARKKNGEIITVSLSITTIQLEHEPHILGVVRDITERKLAEETLKMERQNLAEANAALKVLLRQREEDRRELEEALLTNVKNLVLPFVEKLKNTRLTPDQVLFLEIVESHLKEITSPFLRTLSRQLAGLTPMEIQVANLIKDGRTSKEIAAILVAAEKTVLFHRHNLRRKLGLTQQKINLRSYLSSLP